MTRAKEKLLIPKEKYLSAGVHIGMTSKTADMKRFIYKVRPTGLAVLNVGLLDRKIDIISNLLAQKKKILIVSRKEVGFEPAQKFAEAVNGKAVTGRFMPGSLTNPTYKEFFEPDIMIVTDPLADKQALKEAIQMRIPIVGLCDTFNETAYLDFVLPCNNKGKKSLALILWLLAQLINKKRGQEFAFKPEDFGYEADKEVAQREEA